MLLKKFASKICRKYAPRSKLPFTGTKYPPGHFYSPLPNLDDFKDADHSAFDNSLRELPGINLNAEGQSVMLRNLLPFFRHFTDVFCQSIQAGKTRFNFDQNFFKEGDALTLYGMLSLFKPAKIIEVGSGHSSAVMLDAADADPAWNPEITFIEPYPERLHSVLKEDESFHTRIIKDIVQNVSVGEFLSLDEGDILFIDSSHVSKIGSDVNYLFFDVLPKLKPGVIIHIHDIFWPFEYPLSWIQEGRAWNEAYLLRTLLTGSDMFELICWNSWLGIAKKHEFEIDCPMFLKDTGGSIYLRKTR